MHAFGTFTLCRQFDPRPTPLGRPTYRFYPTIVNWTRNELERAAGSGRSLTKRAEIFAVNDRWDKSGKWGAQGRGARVKLPAKRKVARMHAFVSSFLPASFTTSNRRGTAARRCQRLDRVAPALC